MAKTFKVGDKVRAIDNAYGITTLEYGFEGVVVAKGAGFYKVKQTKPNDWRAGRVWAGLSAKHFELVDAKPTKKQRIKALEKEVEALKARIDALENGAIPNNETGCNYIANKMAEELKRHLEANQQTPNQRRKAVIERANAFVSDVEDMAISYKDGEVNDRKHELFKNCATLVTKPEYHVNKEKRVVTVLVKGANAPILYEKAIAKCAPGDVFNEHIGKAIALAKAYGLECPKEFTDAPQPEPAIGQLIKNNGSAGGTYKATGITKVGVQIQNSSRWFELEYAEILDDTEVQYE